MILAKIQDSTTEKSLAEALQFGVEEYLNQPLEFLERFRWDHSFGKHFSAVP